MNDWAPFPYPQDFHHDPASIRQHWDRLHAGDAETMPDDPAVVEAWVLFHNGQFAQAAAAGLAAGPAGLSVQLKATSMHATYLEIREAARINLMLEVARRAQEMTASAPGNASAWFWQAYALGRYSQGISVAKALAQGYGGKIKQALEKCIQLNPRHADAHIALGVFHAEVIDKVGPLIGGMTYGVRKEVGLAMFEQGMKLHPASINGLIQQANGLVMIEGDKALDEATRLYEAAAAIQPMDATERLCVELARHELHS